jgi:hypothetical protein
MSRGLRVAFFVSTPAKGETNNPPRAVSPAVKPFSKRTAVRTGAVPSPGEERHLLLHLPPGSAS